MDTSGCHTLHVPRQWTRVALLCAASSRRAIPGCERPMRASLSPLRLMARDATASGASDGSLRLARIQSQTLPSVIATRCGGRD